MSIEIRTIEEAELPAFVDALSAGFLERVDVAKVTEEVRPLADRDRTWAAFDGARICGTFRSWATELTLPGGGRLPAAAVSAVTVLPTHRRRGVLREMVAREHAAARDRGEALGLLYASEYPIYGRFGYGPACRQVTWTVETAAAGPVGGSVAPAGSVELAPVEPASRDALRDVFEAWRDRQPGEIRRRDYRWDYELNLKETAWGRPWKGFVALHRDEAGAVDGYARYHVEEKWERQQPRNILRVDELHALTDASLAGLWRFIVGMDWIATVVAERRIASDRLPWLLANGRAASASDLNDGLWVRLLDVPRALEARSYEREAGLVLEVVDGDGDGGRTRIALDVGPDGASARATDRGADLTIDVSALGAAYLGGALLRDAALARGWDEHRAGALDEATALLRTVAEPWCSTFF